MNKHPFDEKIADILKQNEDQLPSLKDKEQVWKTVEHKLPNSFRKNIFHYTLYVIAACIPLLIGFMIVFRQKEPQQKPVNIVCSDHTISVDTRNPQEETKKELIRNLPADGSKQYDKVQESDISSQHNIMTNAVVDTSINPLLAEEHAMAMQEDVVAEPVEPSIQSIPGNKIKIRISLSSHKKQQEREFRVQFNDLYLAKNEMEQTVKKEEKQEKNHALFQIPLR